MKKGEVDGVALGVRCAGWADLVRGDAAGDGEWSGCGRGSCCRRFFFLRWGSGVWLSVAIVTSADGGDGAVVVVSPLLVSSF